MTRDVTAWARCVLLRRIWFGPMSDGNLLPGLGPPRSAQRDMVVGYPITQTVDRGSFRRERAPNRAAKRCPDWTAVGFAFPDPFLGSDMLCFSLELLGMLWARCVVGRGSLSRRH